MTTLRWAWMAGLVASLVAPSAYSQHREAGDVYWGATLGYHLAPDMEGERQRVLDAEYGAGDISVSVDDGVVGWGVYGGFAVADGLALEAGYLGNTDMEITLRREADRATAEVDLSSSAFYAAVVANFPMPRGSTMYPFVKAGMARWETETPFELGAITVSEDDDGTDPLFGVGVDVPGFGTGTFRGEYMVFLIDDDEGGHHHRFQAGINFTF